MNSLSGTPILNRTNYKEKNTMGIFVNAIPVKVHIPQNSDFNTFSHELSTNMLNNLKHQKYSYSQLLEELRTNNSPVGQLYNIVLSYQVTKAYNKDFGNYSTAWYGTNHSQVDCTIQITDINDTGELIVHYDYLEEKYSKKDFQDLHTRINYITEQILNRNDINIADIDIVTPEEKEKILSEFNNTTVQYPKSRTILNLFEDQAIQNPDKTAVIFENEEITYHELNEKANSLANYLINTGVNHHDVVSILVNRSIDLIVSIFGVIKSGASFVLIDNSLPEERIHYMIEDSGAKYCIVDEFLNEDLRIQLHRYLNTINISKFYYSVYNNENLKLHYEDNLCIIYTSGSTGKPKGVILHKHGYYNLINAFNTDMNLSDYQRILGIATISFDMFVFEVFASLLLGNTLVLANLEEQKDPIAMSKLIQKNQVDFIVTTPSRIDLLLLEECNNPLQNVNAILLGGEKLTDSLYRRLREATHAKVYNSFGPTEVTSACTNNLVTDTDLTVRKTAS